MEAAIKASLSDRARTIFQQIRSRAAGLLADQPPAVDQTAVTTYRNYFDKRVGELAADFTSGSLTINQFERAMGDEVEKLHLTVWAIGRGGIGSMGRNDLREVRRKIGEQKGYLARWAGELRQQRRRGQEFSEASIANRARLYGGAANATIGQAVTVSIGLPRLPQYPGDGKTRCRTNCKCSQKIVKLRGDGNFDIYWRLGTAEHCPDCKVLARKWNPLKIRGGKIL